MAKKTTFVTGAEIFVMGIGGGGSNVVDNMFLSYGSGSDVPRNFWCVNTDGQALIEINDNANKLQIGVKTTGGNGSGGDPETGERAARESEADIRALLKDASMLYITAGMGGGTGTGAAPVIASIARELGVLTLAVVTEPFGFEGVKVAKRAREGIEKLKGIVDALIVVPNEKLKQYVPKSAGLEDAFKTADEILARSVRGVIDVVNTHTRINVDFADIKKLLQDCGTAHIGIGTGKGENKVFDAATEAVKSPLLETDIRNAKGLIVCITGGETVTFDETDKALMMLKSVVDDDAEVKFGIGTDKRLGDAVCLTVIATGVSLKGTNLVAPRYLPFDELKNKAKNDEKCESPEDEESGLAAILPLGGKGFSAKNANLPPEAPVITSRIAPVRTLSDEEIPSSLRVLFRRK